MKVEKNCSYTISLDEKEAQLWKLFVGCFNVHDIKDIFNIEEEESTYTTNSPEVQAISHMMDCMYANIEE